MALNTAAQRKLLKALHLSDDAIEEIMKDGEFDIELPKNIHILDDASLEEVKTRTKKGHEEAYPEILAKRYKEEFGIKLDSKDPVEVARAYALAEVDKALKDSTKSVDERITEANKSIEALRQNLINEQGEVTKYKGEVEQYKSKYDLLVETNEFAGLLPENYNPLLKPSDYRQRLLEEKGILAKKEGGVWVAANPDGSLMKDKLEKNILLSDKIKEVFASTPSWNKIQDKPKDPPQPPEQRKGFGSGGKLGSYVVKEDGKVDYTTIKTMTDFKEFCRLEKIPASKQYQYYDAVVVENKEFNPNA